MKPKVTVVRAIRLRFESTDIDGKVSGYNKTFQKPNVAAEHWSRYQIQEWEYRKFNVAQLGAAYHRMDKRDWDEREAREKKLYRRSLPIFKRMIAG